MSQQQGQNAGDQTSSFFWYVVLLTIAIILCWIFLKKYFVQPLFFLHMGEIDVMLWVLQGWNFVAGYLHLPLANLNNLHIMQQFIHQSDPSKVTLTQVEALSDHIGAYYRYPAMLVIAVLAYLSFFRHRIARFANNYTMNSFKKAEVEIWPEIRSVASLDLVKQDLNKGPWAMAKLPLDFCREHQLLCVVQKNDKSYWSIHHGAAERLFVLQMGPMWSGVEQLPIHIKALFVICVARVCRERDLANRLLLQIAESVGEEHLNFSGIEELVLKYKDHKVVQWILQHHAYVYTVMATLLEIARVEGVLATAEFIWLKPLDRRFWYVLNTVGRWTAVVEVAGVYAHWIAEKKIKRALSTPVVSEAVSALDRAVGEILYNAAGETWHTNNAV